MMTAVLGEHLANGPVSGSGQKQMPMEGNENRAGHLPRPRSSPPAMQLRDKDESSKSLPYAIIQELCLIYKARVW